MPITKIHLFLLFEFVSCQPLWWAFSHEGKKVYETSLLIDTLPLQLLSLQNRIVEQKLQEKKEELNTIINQQHQAKLQEDRKAMRQEIFADAEKGLRVWDTRKKGTKNGS